MLTGKDVAACLSIRWESLRNPTSRVLYEELARGLNERYFAPLQGLVQDWQQLVQEHDELSVMSLAEIEDWSQSWKELRKRTAQLLGEEQKVSV